MKIKKLSAKKIEKYVDNWYDNEGYPASINTLLSDIIYPNDSGLNSFLVAHLLNTTNKLMKSNHKIYWINYGENYKYYSTRYFYNIEDCLKWAEKGPFDELEQSAILFEKFRIVSN